MKLPDPSRVLSFPEERISMWKKLVKKKENLPYDEEMATGSGTEKPVATQHKGQSNIVPFVLPRFRKTKVLGGGRIRNGWIFLNEENDKKHV